MRACIISNILPPSQSGQAIALYMLLKGVSTDHYCFISPKNYENIEHDFNPTERLRVPYYHLKLEISLPFGLDAPWSIYNRAKKIAWIAGNEQCGLFIACTGDLYNLPSAHLASKRLKIPLIPYIFDDYAYQWTGLRRSLAKRLEPEIMKQAKTVIVTNEYMQREYQQRYGVKSEVIHNPCPLPDLEELDKADRIFGSDEIAIVYTGAVYHAHYDAFRNLIRAIPRLKRSDVKLHLYTAQPQSELEKHGISGPMVIRHPHISRSEVPTVLRQATFMFLPLAFHSPIPEVIRTSSPGKTGEYLSVGRPILVHAPEDSFLSWYFRTNQCGVVVDRNDPGILAEEIESLISDRELQRKLGIKARELAGRDFSADAMQKKFRELLGIL